jgi:hypothetical protein
MLTVSIVSCLAVGMAVSVISAPSYRYYGRPAKQRRAAHTASGKRIVIAFQFRRRSLAFILRFFGAIERQIEIAWISAVRIFASEPLG